MSGKKGGTRPADRCELSPVGESLGSTVQFLHQPLTPHVDFVRVFRWRATRRHSLRLTPARTVLTRAVQFRITCVLRYEKEEKVRSTMKAAVVHGPNDIRVRDVPEPEFGEYGALCELTYGAICSGTDLHIVEGIFPFTSPWPTIFGHESIGRVLQVGSKVRHLRAGDLVTRVGTPPVGDCTVTWGGFAECGVAVDVEAAEEDGVPRDQWQGHRVNCVVPEGASPAEATMFTTWRETLSYITRMGLQAGKSVAVIGTGGNGLSYIRHAHNAGAGPVLMIGSPGRREAALRAGATHFADYRNPEVRSAALAASPERYDIVIDAVGRKENPDLVLSLVKAGGTLGVYGMDDRDEIRFNPMCAAGTFTVYAGGYDEPETHDRVSQQYVDGKLDASIWLDLENAFELGDIAAAIQAVRDRTFVKPLVRIRG